MDVAALGNHHPALFHPCAGGFGKKKKKFFYFYLLGFSVCQSAVASQISKWLRIYLKSFLCLGYSVSSNSHEGLAGGNGAEIPWGPFAPTFAVSRGAAMADGRINGHAARLRGAYGPGAGTFSGAWRKVAPCCCLPSCPGAVLTLSIDVTGGDFRASEPALATIYRLPATVLFAIYVAINQCLRSAFDLAGVLGASIVTWDKALHWRSFFSIFWVRCRRRRFMTFSGAQRAQLQAASSLRPGSCGQWRAMLALTFALINSHRRECACVLHRPYPRPGIGFFPKSDLAALAAFCAGNWSARSCRHFSTSLWIAARAAVGAGLIAAI